MKIEIDEKASGIEFVTLEPIRVWVDGRAHIIPAGYRSNGMSVPRILWRLLDPSVTSRTIRSAVIHDYFYDTQICSRREADERLHDDLLTHGYSWWKTKIIHTGLRLFGWTHWRRK